MTRGFYTLTSGMLTQNRMLSTISNNLANVKTPGFKRDMMLSKTFNDMVMNRIDQDHTELGSVSMLRSVDEQATIHSQGAFEGTDRNLDFAIEGSGFFKIEGANGPVYTRNGSFNLDDEGYLVLNGVGKVLGTDGAIKLGTDQFTIDSKGGIHGTDGTLLGTMQLSDFENYGELLTVGEGMYQGGNPTIVEKPVITSKELEVSNVDTAEEMTNSIATQRILQSLAQTVKMYDTTMQSATQIARL